MKTEDIRTLILNEYDIKVNNMKKIKNVYKIEAEKGLYCFKVIKYEFGHFLFLFNAMKHLQSKGFSIVPQFILTRSGKDYIKVGDKHGYLTPWVIAREANYDNKIDIEIASKKLAELHKASEGFNLTYEMRPRVSWMRWIEIFSTRRDEILDFKKRILDKPQLSEFDELYFKCIKDEVCRCSKSIENIKKSDYLFLMKNEIKKRGFCHHDFAYHNVLITEKKQVNIIDFDYCMLDTHLHDLASLLIRRMKNGNWSLENAKEILDTYDSVKKIYKEEIPVMASFIEFPQAFWQIGIQYYWEKQPWGEEFFMKKLTKILDDREGRQEFVNEFRRMNI